MHSKKLRNLDFGGILLVQELKEVQIQGATLVGVVFGSVLAGRWRRCR